MKRATTLIITLLLALSAFAQKHWEKKQRQTVNFGMKAGFNSSMYLVSDFKIKDVTIDDIQNNYKIGYFASLFMRVNFLKHYLQPEICYQISRCEISFDKLGSKHPDIDPDYAFINSTIHSLEIPVLYGYNIIKKGPYGLSVFAGPKLKYIWDKKNDISFDNFDQNDIHEDLYPFSLSITCGVGVNISRIFFDFRYEHGLNNISKEVTYDALDGEDSGNMLFKRRESVLSFSLGFMF